jgi:hypothetical protein
MYRIDLTHVIEVLTGRSRGTTVNEAVGIASSLSCNPEYHILFVSSAALTAFQTIDDIAVPDCLPADSVLAVIAENLRKANCTAEYVRDNFRRLHFDPAVYQQIKMIKRLFDNPLTAPLVPADMWALTEAMA